jgi:hypothetical protein
MRGITNWGRSMDKGLTYGAMDLNISESGGRTRYMGGEPTFGLMEGGMRENGKRTTLI